MQLSSYILLFNLASLFSLVSFFVWPCWTFDTIKSDTFGPDLEYHDDFSISKQLFRRKRDESSKIDELAKRREERQKGASLDITLKFQMRIWINIELIKRGISVLDGFWTYRQKNGSTAAPTTTTSTERQVYSINTEEAEEEDETTRATERETTEAEEETSETMTKKEEEDDDEDDDDDMEDGGEETATEVRNRTIIYKNEEFRQLCEDPVFTAIDVDIDGTEVMIFKGDKFYVMEKLRYGSGTLVLSGIIRDLFPDFDPKGFTSMVTIKEGHMRGHVFAFYDNQDRAGWMPTASDQREHKKEFGRTPVEDLPEKGFVAVMHNREIRTPFVIGFHNEEIYHFVTENKTFKKVKVTNYLNSAEKFPPNITAAFSMPNGFVYLFRNDKYCVRELYFQPQEDGVFCDLWLDTKDFLGCYGEYPPPYSIENYNSLPDEVNEAKEQFCENLDNLKLAKWVDGLHILALIGDRYFAINQFPIHTNISYSTKVADKLQGFLKSPDTVLIVHEGEGLRGHVFAFKQGKYSQWSNSGQLVAKNVKSVPLKAVIHNLDIMNPMAVGFDDKFVSSYWTKDEL